MKVSMDGLRRLAINSYNDLIDAIDDNIRNGNSPIRQVNVEKPLDNLRNVLVTLAYSSQEGEDGWKEMKDVEIKSLGE